MSAKPVFWSSVFNSIPSSVTRFMSLGFQQNLQTSEFNSEILIPYDFTLSKLHAESSDPGSPDTIDFTVRKNRADTSLTCQINGGENEEQDDVNTPTGLAGDAISVKIVSSAGMPAWNPTYGTVHVECGNGKSFISGGSASSSSTTTSYFNPNGGPSSTTLANRDVPVPTPFILERFYVKIETAPGSGNGWTFDVLKNGSTVIATVTISGTATTGNQTGLSAAVAAGDTITIRRSVASGTPASYTGMAWGIGIAPNTAGEHLYFSVNTSTPTNSGVQRHVTVHGTSSDHQDTDAYADDGVPRITMDIKRLYVLLTGAPGSGNSWQFWLCDGTDVQSSVTVTISGTSTSGNDTANTATLTAAVDYTEITYQAVGGTPSTATLMLFGYVGYIAEAGGPTGQPTYSRRKDQKFLKQSPALLTA